MPIFNSCTKYATACPIASLFPGHGCMDDLTTKRSFDSQTTWVIDMHGKYIFKMLFMDVYTTRHRRASGRLVHALNVCTVPLSSAEVGGILWGKLSRVFEGLPV